MRYSSLYNEWKQQQSSFRPGAIEDLVGFSSSIQYEEHDYDPFESGIDNNQMYQHEMQDSQSFMQLSSDIVQEPTPEPVNEPQFEYDPIGLNEFFIQQSMADMFDDFEPEEPLLDEIEEMDLERLIGGFNPFMG